MAHRTNWTKIMIILFALLFSLSIAEDVEINRVFSTDSIQSGDLLEVTYTLKKTSQNAIRVSLEEEIDAEYFEIESYSELGEKPETQFIHVINPETGKITISFNRTLADNNEVKIVYALRAYSKIARKTANFPAPKISVSQGSSFKGPAQAEISLRASARSFVILLVIFILLPIIFWFFIFFSFMISSKKFAALIEGKPVGVKAEEEKTDDKKEVTYESKEDSENISQIKTFIQENKDSFDKETLRDQLINAGYEEETIDQCMNDVF